MASNQPNLVTNIKGWYIGAQATIEALTGVPAGSHGIATDDITKPAIGIYNGTAWKWFRFFPLDPDLLTGIQDGDFIRWREDDLWFERVPNSAVGSVDMQFSGSENEIMLHGLTSNLIKPSDVLLSDVLVNWMELENGAQLLYVGAQAYSVTPGRMAVNGEILSWASNIARTSLSLTANTMYYVYLYNNAGTPAVEESTTVPVWDSALNYYKKTGDNSRRCIGFIQASATDTIRKFVSTVSGRILEIWYMDGVDPGTGGKRPVAAGTATGAWTSFSLAPIVPVHAQYVGIVAKLSFPSAGDDGILGLSPISLGTSLANTSPHSVRDRSGTGTNALTFFGLTWLAIHESQTYYYRLQVISGSPTVYIDVHGARIIR